MEGLVGTGFDLANVVRKKRSNTSRRPQSDAPTFLDNRDHLPSSSTPPLDTGSKVSSDENGGYNNGFRRKEINLNSSASRPSFNRAEGEIFNKKSRKNDGAFGEFDGFHRKNSSRGGSSARHEQARNVSDIKRCSEGVLAPANWKSTSKIKDGFEPQSRNHSSNNGRSGDNCSSGQFGVSSSGVGDRGDSSLSHENKLRKVKLKVGGVTRTIHAKSPSDSASPYTKPSRSSDAPRQRQKLILQDDSDDDHSPPDPMNDLHGIPWKDFQGGRSTLKLKEDSRGRMSEANFPDKQSHGSGPSSEPVRKSKRVPKRRVLDGEFDNADEDDEIRYLERLKTTKAGVDYGNEFGENGEDNKKQKSSKVSKRKLTGSEYDDDDDVEEYGSSRISKEGKKKLRLEREYEDGDYTEEDDEDELGLDVGFEAKRKKQKKEFVDSLMDGRKEIPLTMRQRALQSAKDVSAGANASPIEFPNGLPPAPPRKQKEKLSEVDQQLKKAEAAQRRKMQNEKAALESQKEAIRKILGQDSSRKKREDQQRKRRDELAQERAANAMTIAPNTVRWVMGPTGTIVTFPKDEMPSIFNQKPCSYPPPREKCAGPSCMNPYKYRDSKSNVPLCSLRCYRAVNEMARPITT
ncbi:INO80 complex subunit B-like protein conserved region [Cinnamomum micranthum f. kanehirae]|uniref:INO80 complex subunit B-like protein conserved region n=1 Tax=Cinnamomum micranthum f. kanehirae TaxID=337451 RepID=A0A3S3R7H6_9MAGN|nr:INO80 complex subunit B-like protein conserved region [Cinnamomum micranthum f. kanehirae]